MRRIALFAALTVTAAAPAVAQTAVSWETLAQVRLVRTGAKFEPRFEPAVQRLNGQRVRVQGFMLPIEEQGAQSHFVLSANPVAGCFYCMPGGPESMIEVRLDRAAPFTYDPLTLTGELELLLDDPMGMYYRLKNARMN
ncbi:MAG: DUF3299 domain-containing protein [Rhodothermales bacterium]|nr:DUF3299 domain-containing protein [Rhodothermales bacterium]